MTKSIPSTPEGRTGNGDRGVSLPPFRTSSFCGQCGCPLGQDARRYWVHGCSHGDDRHRHKVAFSVSASQREDIFGK